MPALSGQMVYHRVRLVFLHGFIEIRNMLFRFFQVLPLIQGAQAVKVVAPVSVGALDYKGAVLADHVGIHQGVAFISVQGQNLLEIVCRQGHHQRQAFPAVCHLIGCRHAQQHNAVVCLVCTHSHFLFLALHGAEKRLRIRYLDLFAAEHLKGPILRIQRKADKAPLQGIAAHVFSQGAVVSAAGRIILDNAFNLVQIIVDSCLKVHGDAFIEASHIDGANFADSSRALVVHIVGEEGKDNNAQQHHQGQADLQEAHGVVFHADIPSWKLLIAVTVRP